MRLVHAVVETRGDESDEFEPPYSDPERRVPYIVAVEWMPGYVNITWLVS